MSTEEKDQTSGDEQHASDGENKESSDDKQDASDTHELSDEGKEKVEQLRQAYDDDRPTAVLPGTDGTITGVAINEWLDDDGNPKFGKDEQQDKDEQHSDKQQDKDEQQSDEQHTDRRPEDASQKNAG
jgi:hypothetical protein